MFDILDTVDKWLSEGRGVALATVADTWGSSPRPVGAKMAIRDDMAMIGSVSGGCVENAVIDRALVSLKSGRPELMTFGVSDDTAWDVGLACGGKISVYVEPLDRAWWRAATEHLRQNAAAATATIIDGESAGRKLLIGVERNVIYSSEGLREEQCVALAQTASTQLEQRRSERKHIADLDVLIDVHRPNPTLIIVGGAQVAMALQHFAKQLGYRVVLIDPRTAFATVERFPAVDAILRSYPDKALPQIGLDSESYVAVLTHDPKIDDPALRTALTSRAPYIGVLSSKRAHEQRIQRLLKAGVAENLLSRIRTPIGLNIGAKTPEEIALCIMAEIVAVRNGALPAQ